MELNLIHWDTVLTKKTVPEPTEAFRRRQEGKIAY